MEHDLKDFIEDCENFMKEIEDIKGDGKPFFNEYWK